MAEFGASETQVSEIPSSVTVKAGVDPAPRHLSYGMGDVFEAASGLVKGIKKEKGSQIATDLMQKNLAIADSMAQPGGISQLEATSRIRANLIASLGAVGNNTEAREQILSEYGSFISKTGMGKIVDEGNVRDQARKEARKKAFEMGLVKHGATEAQLTAAEQEVQSLRRKSTDYDERMKVYDEKLKTLEVGSKERQEQKRKVSEATEGYLLDTQTARLSGFTSQLESIANDNTLDATQKVKQIEQFFQQERATSAGVFNRVEGDTGYLEQPYVEVKDLYIEMAKGNIAVETGKNRQELLVQGYQNQLMQNPEFARFFSLSGLVNSEFAMTWLATNTELASTLNQFGEWVQEDPSALVDPKNKAAYEFGTEAFTEGLTSEDETLKQASEKQISKMLESIITDAGRLDKDARKGLNLTDWFAKTSTLEAVKARPDLFNQYSEEITEIYQTGFKDEVMDMVSREFTNKKVTVGFEGGTLGSPRPVSAPVDSLVQAVPDARGMRFDPLVDSREARKEAKRLNSELKPILNKTMRAAAHMEGHDNYQKVWEDSVSRLFPEAVQGGDGDTENPGSQGQDTLSAATDGDELTIDDFRTGAANAEPLDMENVVLHEVKEGKGFTHGRTMDSVDGMIIHHTGGRGDAETVKRVLQERGLSVQFVIDRNGKVHQLMPDNAEAWHAGKNNTSGYDNKNTVGVEIIGNDDSDILPEQVSAAQQLIKSLSNKYGFDPRSKVFGHGEVATHKRPTEGQAVLSALRG